MKRRRRKTTNPQWQSLLDDLDEEKSCIWVTTKDGVTRYGVYGGLVRSRTGRWYVMLNPSGFAKLIIASDIELIVIGDQ